MTVHTNTARPPGPPCPHMSADKATCDVRPARWCPVGLLCAECPRRPRPIRMIEPQR